MINVGLGRCVVNPKYITHVLLEDGHTVIVGLTSGQCSQTWFGDQGKALDEFERIVKEFDKELKKLNKQ